MSYLREAEWKYLNLGKCVDKCTNGYGLGSEMQKVCYKCKTKDQVASDGYCVLKCPDGLTYVEESEECLYSLKLETSIEAEIKGYCLNNGKQYLADGILKCDCPNGYLGYKCSYTKEEASIEANKLYTSIFSYGVLGDDGTIQQLVPIDYDSNELLSNMADLIDLLRNDTFNPDEEFTDRIIQQTKTDLESLLDGVTTVTDLSKENFLAIVTFGIEVSLSKARRRRLTEEQNKKLDELISIMKKFYAHTNELKDSFSIKANSFGLFNTYSYKNTDESKKDLYNKLSVSDGTAKLAYITLKGCSQQIPEDATFNLLTSTDSRINLTASQGLAIQDVNDDILNSCKISYNYKTKCDGDLDFSSSDLDYITLTYGNRGVDFNDPNDPFFNEICYTIPDSFDMDFSLKSRFIKLYPSKTSIDFNGSDKCKMSSAKCGDVLEITCDTSASPSNILVLGANSVNNKKTDYNLVTKCAKKASNLFKNAAFIVYMILVLLLLIGAVGYIVIDILGLFEISDAKKFQMDEGILLNPVPYIKDCKEKATEENKIEEKEISNATPSTTKDNKSITSMNTLPFSQNLPKNLLKLHPVTSIGYLSFVNPIWFKLVFFISGILILFGFNSVFFSSKYLDTRMIESNRNSMAYPLIKEFPRIILSIICCMVITLIARAISYVTDASVTRVKDNSADKDNFAEFKRNILPRRIGSVCLLLGVVAFCWYYSTAFCYIYHKTQAGWIYGGIWSLLFNYIIFRLHLSYY